MQTSTKIIIGGAVAAGALYLLWPKTSSAATAPGKLPASVAPPPPAPLLAAAAKPGAILLQPDPNSVALVQTTDPSGTPIWGLTYTETVSLGGNVVQSSPNKWPRPLGTGTDAPVANIAVSYPVSAGPPPAAAVVQALLTEYAAGVPTGVAMANPAGGVWTATYNVSADFMKPDGTVGHKNTTGVVPMTAYPSSGPQPDAGTTTNAVYADLMQNL